MTDRTSINPTRRSVTRLAGTALAAGMFTPSGQAAATVDPAAFSDLFADARSAAAIGLAYLLAQPEPRPTVAALHNAVIGALQDDRGTPRCRLEARFRARVRQDFEVGRVVSVDGWTLSRLEAEICAIVSLSSVKRI
jgi:hypothetical protein